ncbi:MAG: FAD-dependent oxidoreductase [Zavarzinella sp.]
MAKWPATTCHKRWARYYFFSHFEHCPHPMKPVYIVGGGLAGLAAAVELGKRKIPAILLESNSRLGGRAGSFFDSTSGEWLDNCQHVSMGCCTHFHDFCRTVGIEHYLQPQPKLYFMTKDSRVSEFSADHFPAPLHLARSFLKLHFLNWWEKLAVGRALLKLWLWPPQEDGNFLIWLQHHNQSERAIKRFWETVLISALNEQIDQVSTHYARKVFADSFFSSRKANQVFVPKVPLHELYGAEMQRWLQEHQIEIRLNQAVKKIHIRSGKFIGLELRDGEMQLGDHCISHPSASTTSPYIRRTYINQESSVTTEFAHNQRASVVSTADHFLSSRGAARYPQSVVVCQGFTPRTWPLLPGRHQCLRTIKNSGECWYRQTDHPGTKRNFSESLTRTSVTFKSDHGTSRHIFPHPGNRSVSAFRTDKRARLGSSW